jgi:beta-galactosidase
MPFPFSNGNGDPPTRRAVLRAGLMAGAGAAGLPLLTLVGGGTLVADTEPSSGTSSPVMDPAGAAPSGPWAAGAGTASGGSAFNTGWLFGGEYTPGVERANYDDSSFAPVTLPHTVTQLSWGNWDPASWQKVWIYRRHFDATSLPAGRVFADFDGVMVDAVAMLNGHLAGSHSGGYLPWSIELTQHLIRGDNVLAVVVDSRCLPVPPGAPGVGPRDIDYLQPGGIYRDAALRVVPPVFVADVFARPVDVLTARRRVDIQATIDAAIVPAAPAQITVELLDGSRQLAAAARTVRPQTGITTTTLTLTDLGQVTLWSPGTPKLYTVRATLSAPGGDSHTLSRRIGFREAAFRPDGFYLNGERLQLFGLDRHQLFPYLGMAAPARLQRQDAEILKHELNCTMVRCSHYPQSPHFLDACDELGLLVWEEAPGWQHTGGPAWQDLVTQNVRDMVLRDRNRPSVIIWGTRLNETAACPGLYARTRRLARQLDGSRPSSGAMDRHSTRGWSEDVFAFDDYRMVDGHATLRPPLDGVPYLVTEAVGVLNGPPAYRWTDPDQRLAEQALLHAEVHDIAGSDKRYAGLLGWCAVDYASLNGGDRVRDNLKTPGVVDTFRIAKPGAGFYRSQGDPGTGPVILPAFCWGPGHAGPERAAVIFTNCDRLEIYAGGRHAATGMPDRRRFAHLAHPPVFADLTADASPPVLPVLPELRIDGYLAGRKVATTFMSADPSLDRLSLTAGHAAIGADGSDATRITFRAVDAHGNHRRGVTGNVDLTVTGPAVLIGDNPFPFGVYGPVGGAFVRSLPGRTGQITVIAEHPALGRAMVQVTAA